MEALDSRCTVQFIRRLRPYRLLKSGNNVDPFVYEELKDFIDEETLFQLDKYTRGMYDIDLHYKSFHKFARSLALDKQLSNRIHRSNLWNTAKQAASEALRPLRGTVPIDTNDIDYVRWRPSTAAGWSYPGLKKKDCYLTARNNAIRALRDFDRWRDKYRFTPDKAFARSQLALRDNPKIRHVWGRDFHNVLIELLFAQPLTLKCLTEETPLMIGLDIHKDLPYSVIRLLRDEGWTAYGLDFSCFDSSLCSGLINWGLDLLEELFIIATPRDRLVWDFIRAILTHTHLVMPDGNLYKILSGMPSGTGFTCLLDSVCNLVIIYAIQYHFLSQTVPTKILGDDSLFAINAEPMTIEEIRRYIDYFGMKLNIEKSFITRNFSDIYVLGHKFYGSRVTREEFTVLSLSIFTEDAVLSPYDSAIRIASLIVDCGYNSFILLRIYKRLLNKYKFNWDLHPQRPADINEPFTKLYILG